MRRKGRTSAGICGPFPCAFGSAFASAWFRLSEGKGKGRGTGDTRLSESQHWNPESTDQRFQFAAQERERRRDEQAVLHSRRIVIRLDNHIGHERLPVYLSREQRVRNLPRRGQDTSPEHLHVAG